MQHLILTGASRGIGRALALAVAGPQRRLTLVARDRARLGDVAAAANDAGAAVATVVVDFADVAAVERAGADLADVVAAGLAADGPATLVHNAGLWPSRRELVPVFDQQCERSFVVNHLSPLLLQRALLRRNVVDRVVVVSAGLIAMGKFQANKTPRGDDFSSLKTYAHTKLAAAVMASELAQARPDIDVTALHPGVVQTDLGDRGGLIGAVLRLAKKKWERPEVTAARLARVLQRPRGTPGQATWLFEEREGPWPASVAAARDAVVDVTRRQLGDPFR